MDALLRFRLRQAGRLLESWLLPACCPACRCVVETPLRLCAACRDGLAPLGPRVCARCAGPLPCRDCRRVRGRLHRIRAAWRYAGTGGALVRRFKMDHDFGALGALGRGIARRLVRNDPAYRRACVVPVPLSASKRRQRGFNQAEELGRFVARRLGVPLRDVLARSRDTAPQGSALVTSRALNIEGAFSPRRAARRVAGRPVLLVDDVITSGATLRECARVLREIGATRVEAVVACSAR